MSSRPEVQLVRIFVSSPGDVAEERTLARQFIDSELPKLVPFREKAKFELIAWDDPAARIPMLATETLQDSVNAARPRPADCDIVIIILWARMGTPLPDAIRKPNGEPYLSGTEWEYEDAVNSPRQPQPQVLVYRRTEEPKISLRDPERRQKEKQFERVEAFFARFRDADGSLRGGFNPYTTPSDFKKLLSLHLQEILWRRLSLDAPDETIPKPSPRPTFKTRETFPLFDVFKASGMPIVTFVEPEIFPLLKMSIAQPGRGVVIQGPSGIGKTTALRRALDEIQAAFGAPGIRLLSARRRDDVEQLKEIQRWHNGVVAVDDFHRLDLSLKIDLSDYLKDLADREVSDRKVIIVGIPRTGQTLVDLAFDLSTRIDVYTFGRVLDGTVIKMIEIGERALNIQFESKTDIARLANGSLNIAQLLCYHLSAKAGVEKTQVKSRIIDADVRSAASNVLDMISLKFGKIVRTFCSLGKKTDFTPIDILYELARSSDGYLSFNDLQTTRPDLRAGVTRFIRSDYMNVFYQMLPDGEQHLLFDKTAPALIIDGPQLTFFLLQMSRDSLLRSAGKSMV